MQVYATLLDPDERPLEIVVEGATEGEVHKCIARWLLYGCLPSRCDLIDNADAYKYCGIIFDQTRLTGLAIGRILIVGVSERTAEQMARLGFNAKKRALQNDDLGLVPTLEHEHLFRLGGVGNGGRIVAALAKGQVMLIEATVFSAWQAWSSSHFNARGCGEVKIKVGGESITMVRLNGGNFIVDASVVVQSMEREQLRKLNA